MLLPVLALILVSFAISLPATWALMRTGTRLKTLDSAGAAGHAKELRAIPNIGGIAIFLGIALPMAIGLLALHLLEGDSLRDLLPAMDADLRERILGPSTRAALALLLCITALHITGLVDDRRSLGPLPKLLVQTAAAAVMVNWFDVRLLTLLGDPLSIIASILWIILITNAMNFLDNMDGLAAGVTVIAGALFMAAALVNAQWFIAATLALLIGASAGFLVFNFPPAKIFMGDGGSLIIGFLLGVLTARTTFWDSTADELPLGGGWYALFMPVVVLAVPLYDLITVTIIRLRQGRSPFVGDQQHFSHRLVQRGLSKRGAVIMIWGATAVTGIGGISLGKLEPWQAVLVGVQTLLVLLVMALFEHASRRTMIASHGGRAERA